jgi:hypothetical protein
MYTGKSFTFSRKEMEEQVISTGAIVIQSYAEKFLRGIMDFNMWFNVSNWSNEKLMEVFCEKCSDDWLNKHEDIDDILLQIDVMNLNENKTTPIKEWVCSR